MLFVQWTNAQNLLTNPGAESDYDSWTKTDGGSGWGFGGGEGLAFTTIPHTGSQCWASSYSSCALTQTIDLLTKGYTVAQLDLAPVISAGLYVQTNCFNGGTISITVELLNSSDDVIYTENIANNATLEINLPWTLKNACINGYGSGVRKIRFSFSGNGTLSWGGDYGPDFDDAYVYLVSSEASFFEIITNNATDILSSSANLNGFLYTQEAGNKPVTFEYGTSASLGTIINADQSPVTTSGSTQVSATLSDLIPSTTYYYRTSVADGSTTQTGDIYSFTTASDPLAGLDNPKSMFALYPNPTTDGFTIAAGEQTATVAIYDLSGALMLTQQAKGETYINMNSLQQGVYMVKVNGLVAKLMKK